MSDFKITFTVEGKTYKYNELLDAIPCFLDFCCSASQDHINQMPPEKIEEFEKALPILFPNGLSFTELDNFLREEENVKDYIDEDYYWEDSETDEDDY